MTKSSMAETPEHMTSRSPGRGRTLLVLIFRLLLLGVGGVTAGLAGVAVAQFYPARPTAVTDPPLLEQLLQRSDAVIDRLRRLRPRSTTPLAEPMAAPPPMTATPAAPQLAAADRQQLQTELTALQADLAELNDRTASLEARMGAPRSPANLETRLQTLEQQLDPATATSPSASTPSATATVAPLAASPIATASSSLMVTLPSDALFTADPTRLRPESQQLLSAVVTELQRYPGATILVAAHIDRQDQATTARSRSFAQAQAAAQQLSSLIGDQYHWIIVGYGQTRPVAPNDSPANRQRNRRLEIGIDPF
jgi:outer membrane protein OmpA-like peptidoglycan-associated protein